MPKKIIPVISITLISIFAALFLFESLSLDRELYSRTFVVDAIYFPEEGNVEISFLDNSGKTKSVVLEILGMSESFQKNYTGSEFTQKVPFLSVPQYGWKTNPVTFVVEHEEFGTIGIKTEIHASNEPPTTIIFSKL
ncbi:MAG: hypothetical protein ACE5RN_05275 [Nitrosopumilaceae archaeon]